MVASTRSMRGRRRQQHKGVANLKENGNLKFTLFMLHGEQDLASHFSYSIRLAKLTYMATDGSGQSVVMSLSHLPSNIHPRAKLVCPMCPM